MGNFTGIGKLPSELETQGSTSQTDVVITGGNQPKQTTWQKVFETISFANLLTTEKGIVHAINELKNSITELNTKLTTASTQIWVDGTSIGYIRKYGCIVELTLNNLAVASGTAASAVIFTVPTGYIPIGSVDFKDTYAGVRFQINTNGNATITAAISSTALIRGTFVYIAAS